MCGCGLAKISTGKDFGSCFDVDAEGYRLQCTFWTSLIRMVFFFNLITSESSGEGFSVFGFRPQWVFVLVHHKYF